MQTGTKERILVAAQKELLDWGRAGLRIDRVAGKAAINKRMIYHHFGDRQGLIEAALNQYAQTLLSASLSRPLKGLLQVLYPQVEKSLEVDRVIEIHPVPCVLDEGVVGRKRLIVRLGEVLSGSTTREFDHLSQ